MKKTLVFNWILFLILVITLNCYNSNPEINPISAKSLQEKINNGEDIIIIDTRIEAEYKTGHIANSIWLSVDMNENDIKKKIDDKSKEIVICSNKQSHALYSANMLSKLGYNNIVYLNNGIKAWINANYPLNNWYGQISIKNYDKKDPYKIKKLFTTNEIKDNPNLKSRKEISIEAKKDTPYIIVEELIKKMKAGENILLIDVRTAMEYNSGYINGAVWIQRGILEWFISEETNDENALIILYCRKDNRSAICTKELLKIGYKNVYTLKGGVEEWIKEGYSLYNGYGEINVDQLSKKEFKVTEYSFKN